MKNASIAVLFILVVLFIAVHYVPDPKPAAPAASVPAAVDPVAEENRRLGQPHTPTRSEIELRFTLIDRASDAMRAKLIREGKTDEDADRIVNEWRKGEIDKPYRHPPQGK